MMASKLYYRFAFLLAALICASISTNAYAAAAPTPCISGMPCIVPATPNDPVDPEDGPSAPDAPNIKILSAPYGACDADFMNQIYSRAWLESQRDNIKAQILVRKPDSILEYTCFDQLADVTAVEAPQLFSESTRWYAYFMPLGVINYRPVIPTINTFLPPGHLAMGIYGLVHLSLEQYINSNFNHRFLGHSDPSLDYVSTFNGGSYDCMYMNDIYFMAKCRDIVTDDRFWRFSELIQPDPRLLPTQCTAGTKITQGMIDLSENANFQYVTTDPVRYTYIDLLQPPSPQNECAAPIPTGIMVMSTRRSVDILGNVTLIQETPYQDMICPNPNCHYDRNRCLPPGNP